MPPFCVLSLCPPVFVFICKSPWLPCQSIDFFIYTDTFDWLLSNCQYPHSANKKFGYFIQSLTVFHFVLIFFAMYSKTFHFVLPFCYRGAQRKRSKRSSNDAKLLCFEKSDKIQCRQISRGGCFDTKIFFFYWNTKN